jgi:hypothetical protein
MILSSRENPEIKEIVRAIQRNIEDNGSRPLSRASSRMYFSQQIFFHLLFCFCPENSRLLFLEFHSLIDASSVRASPQKRRSRSSADSESVDTEEAQANTAEAKEVIQKLNLEQSIRFAPFHYSSFKIYYHLIDWRQVARHQFNEKNRRRRLRRCMEGHLSLLPRCCESSEAGDEHT